MRTINLGSLPVGAMVRGGRIDGQDLIWLLGSKDHPGYPENSVSLIAYNALRAMPMDGKEPSNADANRKNYGNNYYTKSNLHQWLNKGGQPWYVSQHVTDAPPSANNVVGGSYEHENGFLDCLPAGLRAKLLDTRIVVTKSDLDGGGAENITAKVFLPSLAEVAGTANGATNEGVQWPLFSLNNDRIALDFTGKAKDWWMRSAGVESFTLPSDSTTSNARHRYHYENGANGNIPKASSFSCVSSSGEAQKPALIRRTESWTGASGTYYFDYYYSPCKSIANSASYYARPAINLPADLKLTAEPGADGIYDIVYNTEPTISGSDQNKGQQQAPFAYQYSVTDPDEGQEITVTEQLVSGSRSRTLRTFTAEQGTEYTAALAEHWLYAQNGENQLRITADDGNGGVTVRTVSFARSIDHIAASRAFSTDDLITEGLLTLYPQVQPSASDVVVEATNNPFDPAPVWEDVTGKLGKYVHVFENETAEHGFGLGYRFRITPHAPGGKVFFDGMNIRFKTKEGA